MQKLAILLILFILLSLTFCEKKFDIESEKATLTSLVEKTYDSLQKGDKEFPKSFFSENWELFFTMDSTQTRNTKEDWEKSFENTFMPSGNVKITVNETNWIITPSMAISKSDESWEMGIHTNPRKSHNLVTRIYEKRNGKWYFIHVHQSAKQN